MTKRLWLGIYWKILSCMCFASVNGIVRYLTGTNLISELSSLPTHTLMFYQNLIATLIFMPFVLQKSNFSLSGAFKTAHPRLHTVRVVTAVCGIGLWYYSLKSMPITQVVAISFVAPILTILLSSVLLKERLTWPKTTAIILSISGGFLISRPDKSLSGLNFDWVIIYPIIASCIFAYDKIITKELLSHGEKPHQLTIFLVGFITIALFVPCLLLNDMMTPSKEHWPWLILLGATGSFAHFTFSKAYEYADVTFLMPFGISKFIMSAAVGYLAFNEVPDTIPMWIGTVVILASTVLLSHPTANKSKQPPTTEKLLLPQTT